MSATTHDPPPEPAAVLGVAGTPKDPEQLSARMAQDAVRRVHALDDVPGEALLEPRPDPTVPGANYVDLREEHSHPRYWVGMSGEVLATSTDDPRPGPNPEVRRARTRYTSAVEVVRLRYRVPVSTELFATPDAFVSDAFFVHESAPEPVVRWVDPGGDAHDGYRLVDGAPRWDPATIAARRAALAAQPSTAALVEAGE